MVGLSRFVLIAGDGYGCHLESGLQYVTLCGRTFDPDEVDREEYEAPEDPDHGHAHLCFDCHSVKTGGSINETRRDRHFNGGASA